MKTFLTFFMRFSVRTFSAFNPNAPTHFRVCKLEGMVAIETGHSSSPFVLIRWQFQHTHLPSAIHEGSSNTPSLCHLKQITHIILDHSNRARMGRQYCQRFSGCICRLLVCFGSLRFEHELRVSFEGRSRHPERPFFSLIHEPKHGSECRS